MQLVVERVHVVSEVAAPPRRRADSDADSSDGSADSVTEKVIEKVVDTDDEASAGSLDSSDEEDPLFDELIKPPKVPDAATGAQPDAATGADKGDATKGKRLIGGEPLWCDPYFVVYNHPGADFIRLVVRQAWQRPMPDGMGLKSLTHRITPRHLGESVDDPVRTLLVLRAWALWRASGVGFVQLQRGRARHFQDQLARLELDIVALGCPNQLLGNAKANSLLRGLLPGLVDKLQLQPPAQQPPALRPPAQKQPAHQTSARIYSTI